MPPKPAGRNPPGKVAVGRGGATATAAKQRPPQAGTAPSKRTVSTTGPPGKKTSGAATAGRKPTTVPVKGRGTPAAGKGGKTLPPSKPEGNKAAPKKPVWTKEDTMARKIQTFFRGYRCRKVLLELKKTKVEYDQLMDKLSREAYVQLVKLERERVEKERERQEEQRRKRKEEAQRVKRILEAAFDGDTQEIKAVLKEAAALHADGGEAVVVRYQYKLVECTDPNKNTPLSEAGAGGDPDTIRLLVSLGADLNSKGQYGRTPLYRAAFAGHLEAVTTLLESGSDPRIYADDGGLPEHVASNPALEEILKAWDISETDRLLCRLEEARLRRVEQENKLKQSEEDKIQLEIKEAEKEYSARQKQLTKAYEELNKRIYEHDKCMGLKADLTLTAIHDAEEHLDESKMLAERARERLQQAKLKLRLKQKEYQDVGDEEGEPEKADVVIPIRELDDVLMKDVGDRIASSGKWPLLIDCSKQAATFLRYRDTNYLNVCNPKHMEPETIRMAILGAIRYGKFIVLDLLDLEDMWHAVSQRFDLVQGNLLADLMSKKLLNDEKYLSMIKPGDGEEYSPKMFLSARVSNFKLVIVTQLFSPPEELLEQCYVIRIHIPQSLDT